MAHRSVSTIQALCRANLGILTQKLHLMGVMKSTFGESQAKEMYQLICPIVGASVGQHIRHSMDHIELAAHVASSANESSESDKREIHYDTRERGGQDEHDIDEAQARIEKAAGVLSYILEGNGLVSRPVQASFMLSGDNQEFNLPSTIERELGFTAHHAIHHMAMVRIIALKTLHISPEAISPDFGKAPSTIVFDNSWVSLPPTDKASPQ